MAKAESFSTDTTALLWPSQKALPRIQQASPFSFRWVEPQSIAGWTHALAYQRRDQVYCNTPSRTQARSISAHVHLSHGKPQLHGLSNVPLSRTNIFRTILSIPGHFQPPYHFDPNNGLDLPSLFRSAKSPMGLINCLKSIVNTTMESIT